MTNKWKGIAITLALVLAIGAGFGGGYVLWGDSQATIETITEEDYLSVLEGLAVTTTMYHSEVGPPPPGRKYPTTFYEPTNIGTVPPSIISSLTLAPYGQSLARSAVEPQWYREGQTIDILFETNTPVLWQLDKPGTVSVYADFGTGGWGGGEIGLFKIWGFFYEGRMTEIQMPDGTNQRKYSTALRVIADQDGYLRLNFGNYSLEEVEISFSIWEVGIVPNFREFILSWDREWKDGLESGIFTVDEVYNIAREMENYLLRERVY